MVLGYEFDMGWNAGDADGFANADFSGFFLAKSLRRKIKEPQRLERGSA